MMSPLRDADRHRHDFILEPAGLLRRLRLVLGGDGEAILVLAADLPLSGDVLRRVAHVIAVKGVDEAVLQHGVDELQFPHLHPAPEIGRVGGERHRLLTAGDDDVGVAVGDLLQSERNGAQAAAAQLVDAERRLFLRNAGLHRRLAGRILALRGGKNLPEDHFVHFARVDLRRFESALDGDGAELVGGRRAECAVERADGGSLCAGDDDLRGWHVNLPDEQCWRGRLDRTGCTRSPTNGATII